MSLPTKLKLIDASAIDAVATKSVATLQKTPTLEKPVLKAEVEEKVIIKPVPLPPPTPAPVEVIRQAPPMEIIPVVTPDPVGEIAKKVIDIREPVVVTPPPVTEPKSFSGYSPSGEKLAPDSLGITPPPVSAPPLEVIQFPSVVEEAKKLEQPVTPAQTQNDMGLFDSLKSVAKSITNPAGAVKDVVADPMTFIDSANELGKVIGAAGAAVAAPALGGLVGGALEGTKIGNLASNAGVNLSGEASKYVKALGSNLGASVVSSGGTPIDQVVNKTVDLFKQVIVPGDTPPEPPKDDKKGGNTVLIIVAVILGIILLAGKKLFR